MYCDLETLLEEPESDISQLQGLRAHVQLHVRMREMNLRIITSLFTSERL